MDRFIHFDGDDVGNRIELLLLDGKLAEASILSESIADAMQQLRETLELIFGLQVSLFGGDDLIAKVQIDSISKNQIEDLKQAFQRRCGLTISVGVGASVQTALANLRRAKLSGKDQIVGDF